MRPEARLLVAILDEAQLASIRVNLSNAMSYGSPGGVKARPQAFSGTCSALAHILRLAMCMKIVSQPKGTACAPRVAAVRYSAWPGAYRAPLAAGDAAVRPAVR
jgi:hypothetical protein